MRKAKLGVSLFVAGFWMFTASAFGVELHWSYSGDTGPSHWSQIDPKFTACSTGLNQSPINIDDMIKGDLPEIDIDYQAGGYEVYNTGHTIQVNYAPGSTISIDDHVFELKQFHFHAPSENHINGKSFPMEAHLVHADKDGHLAVIAVMFEFDERNVELSKVLSKLPTQAGQHIALESMVDAAKLLPHDYDYYRFNGSLTTPPCTEGVWWFVMKSYKTLSDDQLDVFSDTMHRPNNRPIQDINARVIVQ